MRNNTNKDLEPIRVMEYLYWLGDQENCLVRNLEAFNGGDYDAEIISGVERELQIVRDLKRIVTNYEKVDKDDGI